MGREADGSHASGKIPEAIIKCIQSTLSLLFKRRELIEYNFEKNLTYLPSEWEEGMLKGKYKGIE